MTQHQETTHPTEHPQVSDLQIQQYLQEREEFLALLPESWEEAGYTHWIGQMYDFAEKAFEGQFRDSEIDANGQPVRVFSHSRAVAAILLVECREELLSLPEEVAVCLVAGALLHDVGEDTTAFFELSGDILGENPHPRVVAKEAVAILTSVGGLDDEQTSFLATSLNGVIKPENKEVSAMTGIAIDNSNPDWIKTKNAFQELFITLAGPGSVILKGADKIANMRTIDGLSETRIKKMLGETKDHAVPLLEEYAQEAKSGEFAPLIHRLWKCLDAVVGLQYQKLLGGLH